MTKDNQTKIIDKNKLKRQMEKYQVDIREKEMEELQKAPPEGIYFDGKKDDTLTLEKDERGVWKVVQYNEEHWELNLVASTWGTLNLIVAKLWTSQNQL